MLQQRASPEVILAFEFATLFWNFPVHFRV